MPFPVFIKSASLRALREHIAPKFNFNIQERVSLFSFCRQLRGSLTIETALVLPIFVFAMVSLLYMSEVIRYSSDVEAALHQRARAMAVYAYGVKAGLSESSDLSPLPGIALSETYVRSGVDKYLEEDGIEPQNISYLRSKIMDKDIIDLVAVEEIILPYEFLGIGSFRIIDRARVHAFTGYDNSKTDSLHTTEEIVYITTNGTVYHRDRSCSHLKVTVSSVAIDNLAQKRNKDGGKYYECEYCHKTAVQGNYYITEYGDRFHTMATCPGLKRDILSVPISSVNGRPPCMTCSR